MFLNVEMNIRIHIIHALVDNKNVHLLSYNVYIMCHKGCKNFFVDSPQRSRNITV